MKPEEVEQTINELSTCVEQLQKDSNDHKKFVQTIKRAIKSLRSSILALSTKEAKRQQQKMLRDAEEKGAEKERLKHRWFKRFVVWVGPRALVITVLSVLLAWGLGFVKANEFKAFYKFLNPPQTTQKSKK